MLRGIPAGDSRAHRKDHDGNPMTNQRFTPADQRKSYQLNRRGVPHSKRWGRYLRYWEMKSSTSGIPPWKMR